MRCTRFTQHFRKNADLTEQTLRLTVQSNAVLRFWRENLDVLPLPEFLAGNYWVPREVNFETLKKCLVFIHKIKYLRWLFLSFFSSTKQNKDTCGFFWNNRQEWWTDVDIFADSCLTERELPKMRKNRGPQVKSAIKAKITWKSKHIHNSNDLSLTSYSCLCSSFKVYILDDGFLRKQVKPIEFREVP